VWEIRRVDEQVATQLAVALAIAPVTARCLLGRGLGEESAREFLEPRLGGLRPPVGLADLDVAVARLVRAVRGRERIGVFGDYDVDGVTTCALLTTFLRQVGGAPSPRVAERTAGYGFGMADVAYFADPVRACSLIITGDCGTGDVEAIRHARSLGIDVIVVDHHTVPDDDRAHPAHALINPFRVDSTFPFRGMASVGLAFYVAARLRTALVEAGHFTSERPAPDVRDLLDLVAVGTIADLVPLIEENRILTAAGLQVASLRKRVGLAALLAKAGVGAGAHVAIDEHTVGWKISPRLNAPGRLGDAAPALSLLLARDAAEAEGWAGQLEQSNDRRREVQAEVLEEAVAQALDQDAAAAAVVVAGDGWPAGVVGIVAAKLVEKLGKPAFVIAIDPATGEGRGSARSINGVNLYDALHTCRGLLQRYGGHAGAAGLTVGRDDIDALREGLIAAVQEQQTEGAGVVDPDAFVVDGEVALVDIDEALAFELARLAPFGKANPEPVLLCRGLTVVASRLVGDDQAHLKLELEDADGNGIKAIAFRAADQDPGEGATVDVAFAPSINDWQGTRTVEMTIKKIAVC
jgi:single-stranded-DNA-specific exonuclease